MAVPAYAPAATPALARAFLALANGGESPDQRSLAQAVVAVIAAAALACATPLAWTASPRGKAVTQPAALSSRLTPADDE